MFVDNTYSQSYFPCSCDKNKPHPEPNYYQSWGSKARHTKRTYITRAWRCINLNGEQNLLWWMKEHSSSGAMNATGKVTAPKTPFDIQMRQRHKKRRKRLNDRLESELSVYLLQVKGTRHSLSLAGKTKCSAILHFEKSYCDWENKIFVSQEDDCRGLRLIKISFCWILAHLWMISLGSIRTFSVNLLLCFRPVRSLQLLFLDQYWQASLSFEDRSWRGRHLQCNEYFTMQIASFPTAAPNEACVKL